MNNFSNRSLVRLIAPLALSGLLVTAGCHRNQTTANPADNAVQSAPGNGQQAAQGADAQGNPPQGNGNGPSPQQTSSNPYSVQNSGSGQGAAPKGGYAGTPASSSAPMAYTIPSGTEISVRIDHAISSKYSSPGESFNATVVSPVVVDGRQIIRSGASATGVVTESKSRGRFKGQAVLGVRLENVSADGRIYHVSTSSVVRAAKGRGKRTAGFIGGGAGLGALIGGLAGGGKGALIGGLAGAGAGTAGAAFTGQRDLTIPAESVLTFRTTNPVTVQ